MVTAITWHSRHRLTVVATIAGPEMILRQDLGLAEKPIVFRVEELLPRPVIKLAPGTHYLRGIGKSAQDGMEQSYTLMDYSELRALHSNDDHPMSLFNQKVLIPSSRRGESLLLWPMGVPLPGGMRQWGHHAIVFVGRQHFDEPDLIERLFELDSSESY